MAKVFGMVKFEEALKITVNQAVVFGREEVSFEEAPGRILASAILCDMDMPPFDKSAMDGYACRRADLNLPLEVIETIRAGISPEKSIGPGQCSQIMTGAALPPGADTVIKVEDTVGEDPSVLPHTHTHTHTPIRLIRFTADKTSPNICPRGEDLKAGALILEAGTLLGTRHVPILATVGAVTIEVFRTPSVGVLATGTELVEPGNKPGVSQIRNSNAYQMIAQLGDIGIEADYFGIAPDDETATREMIREALESDDILILSGGVSMGEFDFVPSVLESLGITIHYSRIAIQPGKPTLFGTGNGKFVFGLPGNPVSSYFTLELLVKPFIYRCMGHHWNPPLQRFQAGCAITRKKADRLGWIPIRINQDKQIIPVEYHGSGHIFSLKNADGMIAIPIGTTVIEEGEWVDVRPL